MITVSSVPQNITALIYVDDLVTCTTRNYIPAVERRFDGAIDKILEFVTTTLHGFTVSTDNIFAGAFHNKRGIQHETSLKIKNVNIDMMAEKKFLALIYDQKLNWRARVEHLRRKCIRSMDILKVLTHTTLGADRLAMLRIYHEVIGSKIE